MYNMNNILGAKFGEVDTKITASFKKTIQIAQYNPESIELTSELNIPEGTSGVDKVLIANLLDAQMEFAGMWSLLCKKYITQEEYNERKAALELNISQLAEMYKKITGKDSVPYLD